MCLFACLYVKPVSRSKDYVRPGIKNWFCFMPVHTCVAECAWNVGYIYHWGASFFWGCTSDWGYVPCIYTHARWELPQATQVFVVMFVLREERVSCVRKLYRFYQCYVRLDQFRFRSHECDPAEWQNPGLVQHVTAAQFYVSACC